MLSSQEEQEDRRRTMQNDALVREQTGTMHAHATAEAAIPRGRYSQVTTENVVGAKAGIASAYGACSPALAVQLPPENPLGYAIDDLDPGPVSPAQGLGDLPSGDAPSTLPSVGAQRGGRSPPIDGSAPEVLPASGKRGHAAEPSTLRRF